MDLIEFLTSKEIIIVYIVALVACLLCFIIYIVEKNNVKARQRFNTKELNKLVEQVNDGVEVETIKEEEPVLEFVREIEDAKEDLIYEEVNEEPQVNINVEVKEDKVDTEVLEPVSTIEEADLEYTTIEPDMETARIELQKITEELKEQEEKIEEIKEDNIKLTSYEEEQEENAIISLEELVKKSKDMYEANEVTQYADEGNEPISISELEMRVGKEASPVTEPFAIKNVVNEKEVLEELMEETKEEIKEEMKKVVLDDFNTIKTKDVEVKRFKSSPIISPIFGIEKPSTVSEMELENTADYEKLDQEIKKTNEFLMTLKELQSKLD